MTSKTLKILTQLSLVGALTLSGAAANAGGLTYGGVYTDSHHGNLVALDGQSFRHASTRGFRSRGLARENGLRHLNGGAFVGRGFHRSRGFNARRFNSRRFNRSLYYGGNRSGFGRGRFLNSRGY